ncbi:UvrD-helicase domain-containing protein [bacterium]|nr:UvrD-helicase domain-containing protein [bacterium]
MQRNITNYQVILIDEFQNIENSLLENIAICSFNVNKEYKVFLFGDEKQNIYGKLNFENNESNHDKYNHLVQNLKQIIIEKFNLAKLAEKDIKKELLKYLYESDDFKISNRFNLKDFNKINYISFGNKNYKNEYTQNSEKSYIKIQCLFGSEIQDSISNNSSQFKVIDIRSNNKNDLFTQYKAAGNEYENIVIKINSCFVLENEKLIYRYQKRNNNKQVDIDSDITSV